MINKAYFTHSLVLVVKRQVANKAAVRWKFSVLLREAYVPFQNLRADMADLTKVMRQGNRQARKANQDGQ